MIRFRWLRLLPAALLVVAGCSSSRKAATTSTSAPLTTSTTVTGTGSSNTGDTSTVPVPSTAASPTTQPVSGGSPILTGAGAVMTAPGAPTIKSETSAGCNSLIDAGFRGLCGAFSSPKGSAIWIAEDTPLGSATPQWRALLYRPAGNGQWSLSLRAAGDYDNVTARQVDLAHDGDQKIVFGFHQKDSAATLDIDVVEANGVVALHDSVPHGEAILNTGGGFDTWQFGVGSALHKLVQYRDNAWRVVASNQVTQTPTVTPDQENAL
jgi:hypothetical protein